jgi:hypothetical protein
MSIFLSLLAILIALFTWVCLFKLIPDSLMAMFRFRLWRQRDELAVEVHSGAFSEAEPAKQIMRDIEGFIGLAPQLSPLHIGLMRLSEVGMLESEHGHIDMRKLSAGERDKLEARMRKVSELVADHVLLETPSGWLTLLLGVPFSLLVILFRKLGDATYAGTLIGGLRRRSSEGAAELACREHLV